MSRVIYRDNKYKDVPYETKLDLFNQVKADIRWKDVMKGCFECGVCVGACPTARFCDFSPRVIVQTLSREDVDSFYELMNDMIWDCSQCFSSTRCPRQNSPGGIVTIMREVAVKNGLESAKDALKTYSRIIYKVMSTGTQVAPDMLQPDFFPDWGPNVKVVADNLDVWRRAIPPDTLHTTELAWDVSQKTKFQLYMIFKLTGNLDLIEQVDEGIYDILGETIEELMEEYDVDADEVENILEEK